MQAVQYRSGSLGSGVFRSGALGAAALVTGDMSACPAINFCVSGAGITAPQNTAIDADLKAPFNQLMAVSVLGLTAAVVYLFVKR
jgi:hypothetical protein